MRRRTSRTARWSVVGLVAVAALGACTGGGGDGESSSLQGRLAVHRSDWAIDAHFTAARLVSNTILDCTDVEDAALQDSCYEDREPYIDAVLGTLPCPDGVGGGFEDLRSGTQVVATDTSGDIVGLGTLGGSEIMDFRIDGQRITTCVFSFEVENLPDAEFYSVGIGGRDPVVYRRTELEERDWYLELFLGLPSQPSTRLADYQPPNMPQGPVPDYTSTTETQSQADTTVTTVADESSVTTVEKEVHRDPDEFPPPPEQPVAVSEGAGVAVGANIDCSGSDFLVAVAVRNLTDTTQTVNQAGFFPGGDAGHALLYFDFGSAVGGPTSIEPGETFHHSEAFTGLEWLESSSPVDVYVDFESDPGSLYADLQVTCP